MKENEISKRILARPSRIIKALELLYGLFVVVSVLAALILSPLAFGFLWYHFIVPDALSAAIIGIVCGLIFDFLFLGLMNA